MNSFVFFKLVDRQYQPYVTQQGTIDAGFIRKLFDRLLQEALPALQNPSEEQKKIKNKLFSSVGPFGNVPLDLCMALALRILRLSPTQSPKVARVDRKTFEEVIQIASTDFHLQAWRLIEFLMANVSSGLTPFEAEMAELAADRIRSDLKEQKLSTASQCALEQFAKICGSKMSGFNGSLFVRELAKSGVLGEICGLFGAQLSGLCRRGLDYSGGESQAAATNKRARYHQVTLNDKEAVISAEKSFRAEFDVPFETFLKPLSVFKCGQAVLCPEEHCKLAGLVINVIMSLQQAGSNLTFLMADSSILATLLEVLTEAAVSFQPAFLPPYLPRVLRIISAAASRSDEAGHQARIGLLRIETLIHPRRRGPLVFRPVTPSIERVFCMPEQTESVPVDTAKEIEATFDNPLEAEFVKVSEPDEQVKETEEAKVNETEEIKAKEAFKLDNSFIQPAVVTKLAVVNKPAEPLNNSATKVTPKKQTILASDSSDSEPLPQIVDIGPDE